jgi:hypothetical protein
MHFYLSDDLVQSTGGDDKTKGPKGCPQNGEGQPEGSKSIEMDNLRVQSDQEASASLGNTIRRWSQTSIDLLNKSAELAEKRKAEAAAAAAATATTAADLDVAADARKAAGQAALDRLAAAAMSAAQAGSNVATTLLALPQQQQQQQHKNETVIDISSQIDKKNE